MSLLQGFVESVQKAVEQASNGSIRIQIRENGPYNIITHIDVLKDIFPDEDFTMS